MKQHQRFENYSIAIERGDINYKELEPLYRRHYKQMQDRLKSDGVTVGDYKPRLDEYFKAFAGGWLINYVVRFKGEPVGYSNVYLTNDMHNGEFIAQEDTVFVDPAHRCGIGRHLVKHILNDLRQRGVIRANITAVTDLRTGKIWKRMGFKEVAAQMTYEFREA